MSTEALYTPSLGYAVLLRDNNSDEGMWEEAFVRGLHLPPRDMDEPRVVLDLGANIGLTAASYAERWPEADVWMVEPHPANMALARENAPACHPLQCAVTKDSGYRYLQEEGLTASAYRLREAGLRVYAIGMQNLVDMLGGEIDFCKMDVEGMEWEILERPITGIKHILVEFHGAEPEEKILHFGLRALQRAGFDAQPHPPHPMAVFGTR